MRFILSAAAVAALGLGVLTACQNSTEAVKKETAKVNTAPPVNAAPKPAATPDPADSAPRITLEEAKKDFDAGKAVFIDTRVETQFRQERVKGAINIPVEAVETKYKEIPTGKKIIAYCS